MKLSILPTHRSSAFYILFGLFAIVAIYAALGTFTGLLILCGPFIAFMAPVLAIASHFDQELAAKYNL